MPDRSPPTTDDPALASRRSYALRRTMAAGIAGKVVSVACTLAQVPVVLHVLGADAYGMWIATISVLGLLNFLDFGLGVGMQQRIALAFGREDRTDIWRQFFGGLRLLLWLGGAASLLGAVFVLTVDLGAWFKVSDPVLARQLPLAAALVLGTFLLGLPGNAVVRLGAALQLGWIQALWTAGGSVLALLAALVAARLQTGFLTFVAIACLIPVLQNIAVWFHLRPLTPPCPHPIPPLDRAGQRALVGASGLYAVPQFTTALLQMLPALTIAAAAGPAAVTPFNLLQRLCNPLMQGQSLLLQPLWPATIEARTRGDGGWVRRGFAQSWFITFAALTVLVLVGWQAPLILHWWIGPAAPLPGAALTIAVFVWFGAKMLIEPLLVLLLGSNGLAAIARWSFVGGVFATAALVIGPARWGVAPTLLAAASLLLATTGIGYARAAWRVLPRAPSANR